MHFVSRSTVRSLLLLIPLGMLLFGGTAELLTRSYIAIHAASSSTHAPAVLGRQLSRPLRSAQSGTHPNIIPAPTWWSGACDDNHYYNITQQRGVPTHTKPLANWLGLQACGPLPLDHCNYKGCDGRVDVPEVTPNNPYHLSLLEFECVELVMRYMYVEYGIAPYPVTDKSGGNGAKNVVWNYQKYNPNNPTFVPVANDGAHGLPQPGDVLSYYEVHHEYDPNYSGHTSVVTATAVDNNGNGYIEVIQQNATEDGWGKLVVSHGVIQNTNQKNYDWEQAISGWLHHPGSPPAPDNVTYHSGSVVESTMKVYLILWEPKNTYVSGEYNGLISHYYNDVGGSALYHNNSQYPDSSGNAPTSAVLAGSWLDNTQADAYAPHSTLTDAAIQAEVTRALSVFGVTPGPNTFFTVYTSSGENICTDFGCSEREFCAYHAYSGQTIYAVFPYPDNVGCRVPTSPNNDTYADSAVNLSSAIQMGTATDPLLTGWEDVNYQEIFGLCAWTFGSSNPNYNGGDVQWSGHNYEVQEEWSNNQEACVLSGP